MQKPTLCIYEHTRVPIWYTRAYYTPMSIYCYLFSSFKFEVSQVPNGQKQALVNAIKYVCALTPERSPIEVGEAASA